MTMALLLSESDVRSLLTMPVALDAVEKSFLRLDDGTAILQPRQRLHPPDGAYLHYMAAADSVSGYMGMKLYTSSRGGLRFVVPLFRTSTGELVALVEADFLGQMRTGAASGIATKHMARADARTAGIVGTGLQARTQLEAVTAVCSLERVRAFGRNPERRTQFCWDMSQKLGLPVEPAPSAEEAVCGSDIVIAATNASSPVVLGKWLTPGVHINAIGANFPQKRELDDEAVTRPDIIAVDSVEQSRQEAGDLIQAFAGDEKRWSAVHELAGIVAGRISGRSSRDQITLFKSNGIAIWDVAVAARVFELARERQLGTRIPLWEHCG
ncbi:MAG: ornithine cyclodeaminase family protein [Acidobacteria bacterium]|nr:ornithine cyclodeaminase family protein [Acidobacteriota bacterium]MBI3664232.1 ornithine cyclodeaminase family protein [Acidobacteriota bacterium]